MGNLLGDYGELIACEHYGSVKSPSTSDGYDARTKDGRTVQVKTNHSSSIVGFRRKADLMLVLKVESDGSWKEVYYGEFEPVLKSARYSKRDNKHMIPISVLRNLSSRRSA